ncbi:esterase FE4-like isoform X2 [Planococcus citri]|uniref:esterase FE4-like isoform X2 n=1 Tax=Planococcus citri TaxID=170843 RepID=UPI0031FA3017
MGLFHSKVANYYFRVQNLFCRPKTSDNPHLIVETEYGKLRGKDSKAAYSRKKYCSFLSVPFAAPPVDDLRFRPPQPLEPWEGMYDATYERHDCSQKDPFMYLIIGEEDCLYMNIFTPKPPKDIVHPLPVMFFIHGGGFVFGSGSRKMYAADFMINEDVVLCAPNYRLHAFGFLNLGIEECPGNAGLKDMAFALQWVKRNIRNFGGDPNNVTIFGESAGGCSVHYLMISPLSQGLFHKAIVQSGSALCTWALNRNPVHIAFGLGRKAGFRGSDRKELVEYLKKFSASEITRMVEEFLDDEASESPARLDFLAPSIESIVEGAFLPDDPSKLNMLVKPIPTMWGCCNLEGFILFKLWRQGVMTRVGKDFSVFVRNNFKMDPEIVHILGEEVRQLYFGNEEVSYTTGGQLVDCLGHVMFYRWYEGLEPLVKSQIPPYIYLFSYSGRLNLITQYIKLMNAQLAMFADIEGRYVHLHRSMSCG